MKSQPSKRPGAQSQKRRHAYVESVLDRDHHEAHRFVMFRTGVDECGRCGKTLAEHNRDSAAIK